MCTAVHDFVRQQYVLLFVSMYVSMYVCTPEEVVESDYQLFHVRWRRCELVALIWLCYSKHKGCWTCVNWLHELEVRKERSSH